MADFVLVTIPLVFLFLGVLQVGFALHVRNTVTACAGDGARLGAGADRGPADAAAATRSCVGGALSPSLVQSVVAGHEQGGALVTVRVQATLPVLGPLGPAKAITVVGHAVEESAL